MDEAFENLSAQLDQLDEALNPFLEGRQDAIKDVRDRHGPKGAAEVQLALGYTVNALFFAYLKTQGIDPDTHPVKDELARVREHMQKLKNTVKDKEAKDKSLKLNKDAANRFISAALSGATSDAPEGDAATAESAAAGAEAEGTGGAGEAAEGTSSPGTAKRKSGGDSDSTEPSKKKQKGTAKKKKKKPKS